MMQPSQDFFLFLRNPNYGLLSEALTTRRRGRVSRGAGFSWSVEKGRLRSDLVTKPELDVGSLVDR